MQDSQTSDVASAVISDAEVLLKTTASESGDKIDAARERIKDSVAAAKTRLTEFGRAGMDKANDAGRAADDFVHDHPWKAVGLGAAIGMIVGLLAARSSAYDSLVDTSSEGMKLLTRLGNTLRS